MSINHQIRALFWRGMDVKYIASALKLTVTEVEAVLFARVPE
jgi:hypothetical protein